MKVLLAPFGSRGDVQPMVALGLALRARGHAVTVCTAPDFVDWVRGLGLEAHPIGPSMREFVARSAEGLRGMAWAGRALPKLIFEQYAALEPFARDAEVMLGSTLTAAGAAFAEAFSLRYHYVTFTPAAIPSAAHPSLFTTSQTLPGWLNRLTWWLSDRANDAGLRGPINAGRRALGLPPIRDAWRHLLDQRLLVASEPALGGVPPDARLEAVQTGAWFLDTDDALPPEVEAFLASGPPPVIVDLGSSPVRAPARATRRLLAALEGAGARALLAHGVAGLGGGPLPSGVLAIGPTPHHRLFPRCAAVVHHGGAGTTVTAARAGVPQLVVPQMTDQFFWRARLLERGLTPGAPALSRPAAFGEALRACAQDPGLRARAAAFASTVTQDGIARAVRLVEGGTPA